MGELNMQAIETRFLCPTNTRGARIKAITESGLSVTVHYDHELSGSDAHWPAALALATKLGWHGEWVACSVDSATRGYVFALVSRDGVAIPTLTVP